MLGIIFTPWVLSIFDVSLAVVCDVVTSGKERGYVVFVSGTHGDHSFL